MSEATALKRMGKRKFVKALGLAAGLLGTSAVVQACAPSATPTPAPPAKPTEAPKAVAPTAAPAAKPTEAPKAAEVKPTAAEAKSTAAAKTAAPKSTYQGKFVVVSVNSLEQGMKEVEEGFVSEHPGVKVEHLQMISQRFVELFTAAQNAGEQIDIMHLNGQDLRRYATGGQMVELTKLDYLDRFQPIGLKTYTIAGKLWALPWGNIGGFPIYFNNAILKQNNLKPPETYDELLQVGKELKAKGVAAYTHPGKDIYLWPVWYFTTYAQTSKNQSMEYTVETLKGQRKFTDPESVAALDAIFKFAQDDLFVPGVLGIDRGGSDSNLYSGKAVFLLDAGVLNRTRQANPPNFELDVYLLPWVVSDRSVKRQYPGGTGGALGIYRKIAPERETLAQGFIEYATRPKVTEAFVRANRGSVATVKDAKPSDDPLAPKEASLIENLKIYLDWFWPPEITRAFQEGIQAGVAKQKDARRVANDIQAVFDKLVTGGYKYQD